MSSDFSTIASDLFVKHWKPVRLQQPIQTFQQSSGDGGSMVSVHSI